MAQTGGLATRSLRSPLLALAALLAPCARCPSLAAIPSAPNARCCLRVYVLPAVCRLRALCLLPACSLPAACMLRLVHCSIYIYHPPHSRACKGARIAKFEMIGQLLASGFGVLYAAPATVFLHDPFESLYRDADIEAMSLGWDDGSACARPSHAFPRLPTPSLAFSRLLSPSLAFSSRLSTPLTFSPLPAFSSPQTATTTSLTTPRWASRASATARASSRTSQASSSRCRPTRRSRSPRGWPS